MKDNIKNKKILFFLPLLFLFFHQPLFCAIDSQLQSLQKSLLALKGDEKTGTGVAALKSKLGATATKLSELQVQLKALQTALKSGGTTSSTKPQSEDAMKALGLNLPPDYTYEELIAKLLSKDPGIFSESLEKIQNTISALPPKAPPLVNIPTAPPPPPTPTPTTPSAQPLPTTPTSKQPLTTPRTDESRKAKLDQMENFFKETKLTALIGSSQNSKTNRTRLCNNIEAFADQLPRDINDDQLNSYAEKITDIIGQYYKKADFFQITLTSTNEFAEKLLSKIKAILKAAASLASAKPKDIQEAKIIDFITARNAILEPLKVARSESESESEIVDDKLDSKIRTDLKSFFNNTTLKSFSTSNDTKPFTKIINDVGEDIKIKSQFKYPDEADKRNEYQESATDQYAQFIVEQLSCKNINDPKEIEDFNTFRSTRPVIEKRAIASKPPADVLSIKIGKLLEVIIKLMKSEITAATTAQIKEEQAKVATERAAVATAKAKAIEAKQQAEGMGDVEESEWGD